jgi:hypothetical protein
MLSVANKPFMLCVVRLNVIMLSVVAPKVTDLKVKVTLVLQQSVQQLFVRMTSQESPNGILTIISNLIIYYF